MMSLFVFFCSKVNVVLEGKEFVIEKSMVREIKRYQKEVHGEW